ncbi:Aste57867_19807 [Aphanomyces stellatus]|uniref:Aste57867_19807 protein n=1 Tax=Aphanomyces stellatus TaxID=120398 RepID=A0A485LFB4_9STRA|nr:hypothetical protein As57867_019742 [Aphanomyces stellatus]VFT96505.1 Aste57867_19807 [Aphanomyces stellatus]
MSRRKRQSSLVGRDKATFPLNEFLPPQCNSCILILLLAAAIAGLHLRPGHRDLTAPSSQATKRHSEPMTLAMSVQNDKSLKLHGLWPKTDCAGTPTNNWAGFDAALWSSTGPKSPKELAAHEYAKHGFCNYASPGEYYGEAQALARAAKRPDSLECPIPGAIVRVQGKKVKHKCNGKKLDEIRYCYNHAATWVGC